ncbi:head maturation protease, ClpP-related [Brevibacillus sp. H7]|uniref:head maturation protease, ClpP-related n=1 Tax=Brevibacillus sp. H7 TaxID=3349138 RepID=UPI00382B5D5D
MILYGPIASTKPWWSDGAEGIYPKQFAEDLKALGTIKKLTVRLNSSGGDVFAANAIYTQLKSHAANVTVIIDGVAASAATIIAMAGDTIKAPSNALLMIHDPMFVLYGYYNTKDMEKMSSVLDTVKESILNAYVNKTGRDRAELSEMMSNETWMTAEEAKEEGFVDEIMFDEDVEATATNDGRFLVVNSIAHDLSFFQSRPMPTKRAPLSTSSHIPAVPKIENAKPKEELQLEIKNLDDLKKRFPDLCNQLEEEAQTKERERIKAIDEISATIDSSLVAKAKYETPMTAQNLAFEALKADAAKGRQYNESREEELKNACVDDVGTKPLENTPKEVENAILDVIAAAANQKRNKEAGR